MNRPIQILYRYPRPGIKSPKQIEEITRKAQVSENPQETCEMFDSDLAWHEPTEYANQFRSGYCGYGPNKKTIELTPAELKELLRETGGELPRGLREVIKLPRKVVTRSNKPYTPRRFRKPNLSKLDLQISQPVRKPPTYRARVSEQKIVEKPKQPTRRPSIPGGAPTVPSAFGRQGTVQSITTAAASTPSPYGAGLPYGATKSQPLIPLEMSSGTVEYDYDDNEYYY
jgi:hypothetical protein